MKIVALRHGKKDSDGNLTPTGIEESKKVGGKIPPLHLPVAVSSTTPRVRDTVAAVLEGNGTQSPVKLRRYLSVDGFSAEFNLRWGSESKKQRQEDVMSDFLD